LQVVEATVQAVERKVKGVLRVVAAMVLVAE